MKNETESDLDKKINRFFDANDYIKMNISGTSMIPLLNEGDEIRVQKANVRDARRGDILLFRINNTFVVHRFISISVVKDGKAIIVQCGDNSMEFNTVDENSVVGKVAMIKTEVNRLNINSGVWTFLNRTIGWLEYLTYLSTFPRAETDDRIFLKIYNRLVHKIMRIIVRFFCVGRHIF